MSKNMSRRSFLKGAAGTLALTALTGSTLTSSALAEAGVYTPGSYTSIVKAYAGYVKVTMTFDANSITACDIDASAETPEIGGVAAAEYAEAVVKGQDIDVVTSASAAITLPAIKKAAANCVAQAKGEAAALVEMPVEDDGDWLGTAPEIADDQIAKTEETDLLIVGAGNGGMMAAATAADAGVNFMLCEQGTTCNATTRKWIGAIGTPEQDEAGVVIQKDRLLNEIARYASYKVDMSVIKAWIDNSAEMIAYLESLGMTSTLHIAPESHVGGNNMEYYVPSQWFTMNLPEGVEGDRHTFLEQHIKDKGYSIRYGMTLVRLTQAEDGQVTGAIFTDETGAYVKVNAKNVILATGGYPGNPKMIKALAPIVTECVTANSYYGPNTGVGIKAGLWAGAKMDTTDAPMIFDRGLVAPGVKAGYVKDALGNEVFPATLGQFLPGTQPWLKVNKEGYRFANESCPYDFFNHAASLQTDGVYAMITDSDLVQDVIDYDQYGCAQLAVDFAKSGILQDMFEQYVADGLIMKADTIEELAGKLGIPADTLTATVARYNELCEKGVDEDFGKEAYRMKAVDHGPFYGGFLGGSLLCTCDGLRINDKCQVYDKAHKVIKGLYAIGNCSGSFFAGNYPEYFVGVAVGRTMTQGRIAVKTILAE